MRGIPLTISFFAERLPESEKGFRRYRVVQKKKFTLGGKSGAATTYDVISRHWTARGAENRALGMNQHYGRG